MSRWPADPSSLAGCGLRRPRAPHQTVPLSCSPNSFIPSSASVPHVGASPPSGARWGSGDRRLTRTGSVKGQLWVSAGSRGALTPESPWEA